MKKSYEAIQEGSTANVFELPKFNKLTMRKVNLVLCLVDDFLHLNALIGQRIWDNNRKGYVRLFSDAAMRKIDRKN